MNHLLVYSHQKKYLIAEEIDGGRTISSENMEFADVITTPTVDGVVLHSPHRPNTEGTLCITGHHLIFSSRKQKTDEIWLLHRSIDTIEKKLNSNAGFLILKCKDFKILQLDIPGIDECNNIAYSIEVLSGIENPSSFYPFFYRPMFEILEDGWTAFLLESEFSKITFRTEEWRISHVNKDYSVCHTYPQCVLVPKCIDDEMLRAAASFRQLGRFPVLSYYHRNNAATLMRSSQPLIGTNTRRCREDEKLINAALGSGKRGYIIDTRTQNVAQMARAKVGGGFEPEVHYPQWRRVHKPIDRHFALLDSLAKLIDACNDTNCSMEKWQTRLETCNWLTHIKDIMNCSCVVAQCIDHEGASVLVHGSEGLDSTLQVTSLAQIILDPDCRTVRGFEALVEREWLQAGHPFSLRCQHSAYYGSHVRTKNIAPTFLVFLDCVWQIHQQFPCSFEFNEQFLILLFEHAYSSQYGTFIGNCEAQRKALNLNSKTVSLWSYLNRPEVLPSYLNPLYEPNNHVIWPSVAPMSLNLWNTLYLRWVCDHSLQELAWGAITEIKVHDKELRFKVMKLRRELLDLQKEAVDSGVLAAPTEEISVESS